jgi:hypothetical protein
MNSKLECSVTSGVLSSGTVISATANCAAVIGVAGILLAHSQIARILFLAPVLLWPAAYYFSIRVRIDASLFKQGVLDGDDSGPMLDAVLRARGFTRPDTAPSLADRHRGAIRLWKRLIAITTIQVVAAVAAAIVEVWTR